MKFECISGRAYEDNVNVMVMQGDVVELVETRKGEVVVNGIAGWCKGKELVFRPNTFCHCFKVIGLTYII